MMSVFGKGVLVTLLLLFLGSVLVTVAYAQSAPGYTIYVHVTYNGSSVGSGASVPGAVYNAKADVYHFDVARGSSGMVTASYSGASGSTSYSVSSSTPSDQDVYIHLFPGSTPRPSTPVIVNTGEIPAGTSVDMGSFYARTTPSPVPTVTPTVTPTVQPTITVTPSVALTEVPTVVASPSVRATAEDTTTSQTSPDLTVFIALLGVLAVGAGAAYLFIIRKK